MGDSIKFTATARRLGIFSAAATLILLFPSPLFLLLLHTAPPSHSSSRSQHPANACPKRPRKRPRASPPGVHRETSPVHNPPAPYSNRSPLTSTQLPYTPSSPTSLHPLSPFSPPIHIPSSIFNISLPPLFLLLSSLLSPLHSPPLPSLHPSLTTTSLPPISPRSSPSSSLPLPSSGPVSQPLQAPLGPAIEVASYARPGAPGV